MKRPKPTKQLIADLCGGNQHLISCVHHGLYELPLRNFYPNLDLDEVVAFAASSWNTRDKFFDDFFLNFLTPESASVYEIFSEVFGFGMPWLNKHKCISPELKLRHEKLNPFNGRNLRARLDRVSPEAVEGLRYSLAASPNEYVFECQYRQRKRERGDNIGLEIMRFQNVYPKSGRIVPAYAAQIARMLSTYPTEYESLETKEERQEGQQNRQARLF